MEEYKRGDIFLQEKDRLIKMGKRVNRGEAIEEMMNTKGWEYISEFLSKLIENHRKNLETMLIRRTELDKLIDIQITIKAYEFLLNLPHEFVLLKNKALKNKEE